MREALRKFTDAALAGYPASLPRLVVAKQAAKVFGAGHCGTHSGMAS